MGPGPSAAAAASGATAGERARAACTPLPLTAVRLTGGPLRHAQDLDADYLLALDPDRMLSFYRQRAGLAPRAGPYGGWDGGGRNLTGHIAGHYLSAVGIERRFAEWAEGVLENLDENQLEHMTNTEIGGMAEVMVDLYTDTGDERWLGLSRRFEHDDFTAPLKAHRDNLPGKHGNTAVPKLIGSADRYVATGEVDDLIAASFFWNVVVADHTFATGGHGKDEYFGPAGKLSARVDGRTAETCNVYNMLKLTRRLFAISPYVRLADFHERALFNHIMGSMDPNDGRTCYMVPVGRGVQHEYQDMFESFTCCVKSGMESHALHGDGIYFESGNRLYVNLYVPSEAKWSRADATLTMETDFPLGEHARLRLEMSEPRSLTLSFRQPSWTGDRFALRINGEPIRLPTFPDDGWRDSRSQYRESARAGSRFVDVTREWKAGDVVDVDLPKSLWLEPTPDNPRRAAVMWGPLVLAGDLGPERQRSDGDENEDIAPPPPIPVLVAAGRPVAGWLRAQNAGDGTFRTTDVAHLPTPEDEPTRVEFAPFYRLHRRTYAAYWDFFTPEDWEAQKAVYAGEAERCVSWKPRPSLTSSPAKPGSSATSATAGARMRARTGSRGGRRVARVPGSLMICPSIRTCHSR